MADYYAQCKGVFLNGRPWTFGVHLQSNNNISQVLTDWNTAWTGAWNSGANALKQFYPAGTSLTDTEVALLNATFHQTQKQTQPNVIAGTAPGDTLPIQEAVVVSERSLNIQKHGRGRFYLPALEETFVNNNVVDPAALTKISAAVNAVKTAMEANGASFFVVSLKAHKDGTGQYIKTPIVQWKVSNKPARQSKRNNKTAPVYV